MTTKKNDGKAFQPINIFVMNVHLYLSLVSSRKAAKDAKFPQGFMNMTLRILCDLCGLARDYSLLFLHISCGLARVYSMFSFVSYAAWQALITSLGEADFSLTPG